MILLLGTTPDDILYIKNRMIMKEKGAVNKDEHFYFVGEYGGKEICMTYTGHSNIMSAVLTSYMIRKFNPYLVISIGSAQSASSNLNQGDLFIAERVYIADLDYNNYTKIAFLIGHGLMITNNVLLICNNKNIKNNILNLLI
ncbi:MAG TPA: hypothetical protein PKO14_02845, partial [Bacilli bacterium]|nr:hypothetical protein [Bacilli bacterium]